MTRRGFEVAAAAVLLAAGWAGAADVFDVLPKAAHDPAVPALEQVLGFGWGNEITDPDQVARYARSLADSAPQRVRLLEYGRSTEGRPLLLLVVTSPENLARFDVIESGLARLADPRVLRPGEADDLIGRLPAVVWIQCSVHGDEASGGDAGLALAYHLASGSGPEVESVLSGALVFVDPMENPDGRARFVASTRQARGTRPDPDPAAAEHVQPWPGGRFSHDLFDLNRDWFALSQPESAARVAAMLRYHPTVAADLHEMGSDSGYYFAPPAVPENPLFVGPGDALLGVLGRANAAAFDAHGFRYWTREVYDAFYPGYGDSWPTLGGTVGMTFEEGTSRGLAVRLEDGSTLTYGDAVAHHLLTAFTTCATTAANRQRFLRGWFEYRRNAVAEGQRGPARAYVLGEGGDPAAAVELGGLLAREGVESERVESAKEGLQAGSVVVPLDQPLGRLARALLERGASMGAQFEKEQERRDARRQPDEIYDITAWSLPLLWGVPARTIPAVPAGLGASPVGPAERPSGSVEGDGKVAFLLPWCGQASIRALSRLLQSGVTVAVATRPFTFGKAEYRPGTIVIRRAGNREDLRARLEEIARDTGASFAGTDTGYADSGIDLGSTHVVPLKPPHVAVVWDSPTSPPSAGGLRWALERAFGYPATAVRASSLARADLKRFDVIILPDSWERGGSYASALGEEGVRRLVTWANEGGTVVGVGGGAAFLTGEKVGLLASKLEKRPGAEPEPEKGKPAKGDGAPSAVERGFSYEDAVKPSEEDPPLVPGSILRVVLDTESVLSAGFPEGTADVLVDSRRVFTPLKLDRGTNVGTYATPDSLVQAGFVLPVSREQLPHKAYLMLEECKRGKVVAFAEDPVSRGLTRSAMLLLANAVFFAPAF
ncbi:MAG TPA: M14 family zinc carboxypeptidase [Thermoanaerobaculaceae bacterium]|nr:M14 family zinc carboxypeptidase [Thermoanaerobaculaceae bacterium]